MHFTLLCIMSFVDAEWLKWEMERKIKCIQYKIYTESGLNPPAGLFVSSMLDMLNALKPPRNV